MMNKKVIVVGLAIEAEFFTYHNNLCVSQYRITQVDYTMTG